MNPKKIDQFFKLLNQELNLTADIILVGASAGSLMGHIRPSLDIDFEIRLKGAKTIRAKSKLVEAIDKTSSSTGLAVNYSENISRWSMINYLDYRKTAVSYKRFGKLNVKLIAPEYWTIGKMARFLELDIRDMKKIIRAKRLQPRKLIAVWARAVRTSDLSLELGQFRKHVRIFLKKHGRQLWKKSFTPETSLEQFESLIKKV